MRKTKTQTPTTDSTASSEPEVCVQFMLAELTHVREQMKIFVDRFEQLITLFLTGIAAVLSAIVLLLTSMQPSSMQKAALVLLCIGAWAFSLVIYLRLCITRGMLVEKMAQQRRVQQYFFDRHPHLLPYLANKVQRANARNWEKWAKVAFHRQTVRMFLLLAIFTSLVAALVASLTVMLTLELSGYSTWQPTTFYLSWYIGSSLSAFFITLLVCIGIINTQQKKAEHNTEGILSEMIPIKF